MANEKIYIGSVDSPTLVFNTNSIESIIFNNSVDLIGDEMSSDTLEVSVFFNDSDGVLAAQTYGTSIFYFTNNVLVGEYYISQIDRRGVNRYLIRATSLVGLIEKEDFYGGMYNGAAFSDVVEDILFTDNVALTKYKLYTPALASGSSPYYGTQVAFKNVSTAAFNYKIHLDFTFLGSGSSVYYLAGTYNSNYYITCNVRDYNGYKVCGIGFTYRYSYNWWISNTEPICGIGTRFVIDVDPLSTSKTIHIDVYRVDPEDPTIQEHLEKTQSLYEITTPGTYLPNFNFAYGGTNTSGAPRPIYTNLQWNSYQVYDENGDLFLDAKFATNNDESEKYVINTVTGYVAQATGLGPYGEPLGVVSNLQRIDRDLELWNRLSYNGDLENVLIFGWIAKTTRREALHQLMFSTNVCMFKGADGGILFTLLTDGEPQAIDEANMYDDSSEESIAEARTIRITEYSFEDGTESRVIFDNSSSPAIEGQYTVLFDGAPIMGTPTATGLTIISSNCNAAVVTGRGSITGIPYIKSESIIEYNNPSAQSGKDVSVSGIGLITSANSDSVLNKLKSYYSGGTKRIKNSIVYNGERCGLSYSFPTLYDENNTAFLTKLAGRVSSFVKGTCDFISGFVPPSGSGYTTYAIETYGDTWTVPSEVREKTGATLRLNIIGKGYPGSDGTDGADGSPTESGSGALPGGAGGAGGTGGTGGAGGYIYSVSVDAENVNTISVTNNGNDTIVSTYDDNGTLLNTYNSSSGNQDDSGFTNIFTGIAYARRGLDGYNGGDGGAGGYTYLDQPPVDVYRTEAPQPGNDVDVYSGGTSFECIKTEYQSAWGLSYNWDSYGGGGGAAIGNNGGDSYVFNVDSTGVLHSTRGGAGADAIAPQNVRAEYGSGGSGGNGGGGGGGAGTRFSDFRAQSGYVATTYSWEAGAGGSGSAGSDGIDGCVIIYY